MKNIQRDIGIIHFVGIGGIGMSGIAEVMNALGYKVQGSDISENKNTIRLSSIGIPIIIGHDKKNINGVGVVVVSSAIEDVNPEIIESRNKMIPVVKRAEMLAELMRFKWSVAVGGTHGKTTTTSMVAAVMDAGLIDPTVINGGIIKAYNTNARQGSGDWMVVEADESDGTFVKLPATIAVITNIDPEHLDFYEDFDSEKRAFRAFIKNIPFYGFAVMCTDHLEVRKLSESIIDRRVITYGIDNQADINAINIKSGPEGSMFDVVLKEPVFKNEIITSVRLNMPGKHNILNALAAFLIGLELGINSDSIRKGLSEFEGVERRFSHVGKVKGIVIIDDYAHHPAEIKAALDTARDITNGNVIAVMQPHRFTRLASLFSDFCKCFEVADKVIISKVFSAGEQPINGFSHYSLVDALNSDCKDFAIAMDDNNKLAQYISDIAKDGDIVICLGAGSITKWAQKLPSEILKLSTQKYIIG